MLSVPLVEAIIEFSAPVPSAFPCAASTSEEMSRRTREARSSPYLEANTSPWDWPWSESTTKR